MGLADYLSVFRRRWLVIAVTAGLALVTALLTVEAFSPPSAAPDAFQASTLITSGGATLGGAPLTSEGIAAIATIPPVANRAAKALGSTGDPAALAQRITASADPQTGFVTITAEAQKLPKAMAMADAFAAGLVDFLGDQREAAYDARISALQRDIHSAQRGGDPEGVAALRAQLAVLRTDAESSSGAAVLHKAIGSEAALPTFQPPDSTLVRISIALVIGLLAGAALVLVLERLDTRIRTSDQVTERFGYPVLAEIPSIRRDQRKGVVTVDHPTSPAADAFRLLGAGVHVATRGLPDHGRGDVGRIMVVTSAAPAEGKSTIVANLAAALAEEGKRVIVFSADLRRPTLHEVLGADPRPGLVQAARDRGHELRRFAQSTRFHRVSFVPSGGQAERPGEVLGSQSVLGLLQQARLDADWVLLDTAPILVAGESASLIPDADLVLIVARSGSISTPVAERARDVLHRLGASTAWVVLNDCRERDLRAAYRRYHVLQERDERAIPGTTTTRGFPR